MAKFKAFDIPRMVRERENSISITDEELFTSPQFKSYGQKMIGIVTRQYLNPPTLQFNPSIGTAATDGNHVYLNPGCELVMNYVSREARFKALMGMVFHECAHCNYLNFTDERYELSRIEEGKLPGRRMSDERAKEIESDYLTDSKVQKVFTTIYHELHNFVADVHDEECLLRDNGKMIAECIYAIRNTLALATDPIETVIDQKGLESLDTYLACAFHLARFGYIIAFEDSSIDEIRPELERIQMAAEKAAACDSMFDRFSYLNEIILELWPLLKRSIDKAKENQKKDQQSGNGNGNGKSGNSSGESQQGSGASGDGEGSSSKGGSLDDLIQSIMDSANHSGKTEETKNRNNSSGVKPESRQQHAKADAGSGSQGDSSADESGDGNEEGENTSGGADKQSAGNASGQSAQDSSPENAEGEKASKIQSKSPKEIENEMNNGDDDSENSSVSSAVDKIEQEIKQKAAEDEVQNELDKALKDDIKSTQLGKTHESTRLQIVRHHEDGVQYQDAYDAIYSEVSVYSKLLQRQMKNILRDLTEGGTTKHLHFGRDFDVPDAYRPDQRFYSKKRLPQDLPNMAVSVLVDMSGSMSSAHRIEFARKGAILLYDFCHGLGIPCMVSGHRTGCREVEYHVFSDFNSVGNNDKYRLCGMSAGGCNRDGMAIDIACNLLAKRPEKVKLFIIISDGRPNDGGYCGTVAFDDMKSIVAKYRRRGVETLAAAIGEDKDIIESIYGNGFIDVSDIEKLPKTMTAIVKKRLLRLVV